MPMLAIVTINKNGQHSIGLLQLTQVLIDLALAILAGLTTDLASGVAFTAMVPLR